MWTPLSSQDTPYLASVFLKHPDYSFADSEVVWLLAKGLKSQFQPGCWLQGLSLLLCQASSLGQHGDLLALRSRTHRGGPICS